MTPADARILSGIWHRVRQGDIIGLPDGAIQMSSAMRILRGVDVPAPAKKGRPTKDQAHA